MKTSRDPLDRLLQAAARATRPAEDAASFALEARVLAGWRGSRETDDSTLWVFWLRRAVACACGLILLSATWNVISPTRGGGDALTLANSALQFALDKP